MNNAPCNCESQMLRPSVNERPRYYARQLITPDDLTLEQDYFRTKLRRHNRYLHGWGVVCGADVLAAAQPWKVIVKSGYILGPYGDEIYIETDQCVDVRKTCMQPQIPQDDNECAEAQSPPPTEGPLFVAIRYVEGKTRLIRVPLGGCGCEENTCEYSRFSDGYEICILDHCPDKHEDSPRPEGGRRELSSDCPECPPEPWVVLGEFTVKDDGSITLQESDCRRQLRSASRLEVKLNNLVEPVNQPVMSNKEEQPVATEMTVTPAPMPASE